MSRILVYSHDTYGLGNIRRMLALATELAGSIDDAAVLVLSGSPMLHGFRLTPKVDYIKLPSVTRIAREGYSTRSLGVSAEDVFELRANLALAAVADFRPDVILVDKRPFGVENELEAAIHYAKTHLPETALVLVLRDILDSPDATIRAWRAGGYTAAIERFYDRVLVLGTPDVFDMRQEYSLPASVCEKLRFCGYLRRPPGAIRPHDVRRSLGVSVNDRLVLVTTGGGQDGERIIRAYTDAAPMIHAAPGVRSLIVTGPELEPSLRQLIERAAKHVSGVIVREFTDDMMSCMEAAELVVCMGGYNTLCEVATLGKRAIVVPRVRPVQEQWIRAERLSRAGVVSTIHPNELEPRTLAAMVCAELSGEAPAPSQALALTALPLVTRHVKALIRQRDATNRRRAAEPAAVEAVRVESPLRFRIA